MLERDPSRGPKWNTSQYGLKVFSKTYRASDHQDGEASVDGDDDDDDDDDDDEVMFREDS